MNCGNLHGILNTHMYVKSLSRLEMSNKTLLTYLLMAPVIHPVVAFNVIFISS